MSDPSVINDDGMIHLYYGWSLSTVAAAAHAVGKHTGESQTAASPTFQIPKPGSSEMRAAMVKINQMMFHLPQEEIDCEPKPLMGANTVELMDDMLTVAGEPHRIVYGQFDTSPESSFFGHAFYEASSIRRINNIYYFIYSSENSNELCYARSKYPDRDFVFGGTIISNGDVGYQGRKKEDRLNMTANNHGSLVCVTVFDNGTMISV